MFNVTNVLYFSNLGQIFCRQGLWRTPVAALLALAALLLLLARLPPARRPSPAPQPEAPPAPQPEAPPTEGQVPFGAVLTRDLYVAGHSRPHPELCPAQGAQLRLVILVSSEPSHAAAREAIRLTWGHAAQRADVALGFVLGATPPQLRAAVDREDAVYGDLIEGRFVDSYSNLTLKTLSMLEWVDTYCSRAPRLLKTDDDMFININKLLEFAEAYWRQNATNTVWGNVVRRGSPTRELHSKYFVSSAQFPDSVFPDFTRGPAYLVTADVVRRLLRAAPIERFLRLEDVFVTGVLAARLGVRRVHAPVFFFDVTSSPLELFPCVLQRVVTIHNVDYHELLDLWYKLFHDKNNCAWEDIISLDKKLGAEDSKEIQHYLVGSKIESASNLEPT